MHVLAVSWHGTGHERAEEWEESAHLDAGIRPWYKGKVATQKTNALVFSINELGTPHLEFGAGEDMVRQTENMVRNQQD